MTIFDTIIWRVIHLQPFADSRIGPFTSKHNHSSGLFAIELISGDMLILEYFQPHDESNDLKLSIMLCLYLQRY